MHVLKRTQFGNSILRTPAQTLSKQAILSPVTQDLLKDMRYTLDKKRYGVGLAAPQVGHPLAMAIVGLKPTPTRPQTPIVSLALINPEIVSRRGTQVGMWEACISGAEMYAKVLRYPKVRVRWYDEKAHRHEKDFEGLVAQVLQHEIDHLNGILFVDRVTDPKTYVTFSEYKKLRKAEKKAAAIRDLR